MGLLQYRLDNQSGGDKGGGEGEVGIAPIIYPKIRQVGFGNWSELMFGL